MTGTGIERASSLIEHWESRLEFCRQHVSLRLRPGTERCARWTAFLSKFEAMLSGLRLRRDVLVSLEEAAQLDILPIPNSSGEEAMSPDVAERFAAVFAESERLLAPAGETGTS